MAEKKAKQKERYVAYVGTYTVDKSKGIYVYDIDTETGVLTNRSLAQVIRLMSVYQRTGNSFIP